MPPREHAILILRSIEHAPPPRPGVRHVRLHGGRVLIADDHLRERVNRWFHWPMILLALLVLPLLGVEFLLKPEPKSWLWWCCLVAGAVIWLAFLIEFVVKITIAECRIEYAKRNWLDIAIIVIPLLRPVRAAYLVRTGKMMTLRGVGMKAAKYVVTIIIGFEATDRLLTRFGLKSDALRKDPARMTRHELIREVKRLRRLNDGWEAWHEAHKLSLARRGVIDMIDDGPRPSDLQDRVILHRLRRDAEVDVQADAHAKADAEDDAGAAPGPDEYLLTPTMPTNADRARATEPDRGRHPRQHATGAGSDPHCAPGEG